MGSDHRHPEPRTGRDHVESFADESELSSNARNKGRVAVDIVEGTVKVKEVPVAQRADSRGNPPSSADLEGANAAKKSHGLRAER